MYIPGKVEGLPLQYLLDSGCSGNVMSRSLFNRLPGGIKAWLQPDNSQASMADGSGLLIYGVITLSCRVRTVQTRVTFKVANITDDAILGMTFFKENRCSLLMDKGFLAIQDQLLPCTNRCGAMLSNKVQVASTVVVPPGAEAQLVCRLTSPPAANTGLVEHFSENDPKVVIAATLTQLNQQGKFLVRCLNPRQTPITLRAGTTLGTYTPITSDQIFQQPEETTPVPNNQEETTPAPNHQEEKTPAPNKGKSTKTPPAHLLALYEQACQNCKSADQRQELVDLLVEYADVFSSDDTDVGQTSLVQHSIPVEPGTAPIRQPPRRLGVEKDQEVERQVEELVKKKLVVPADGAWSSPVVLVRKKDNNWRLCVDYRQLNAVTRKGAYPLPSIDDSLDALAGSVYFSTLDLLSGYWQVPMDEDAQEKSAFVTRGGLWKWKVLPFGLTSAPATFERLMEQVLKGLQWKSLLLYLDDIIVFSADFETHLARLKVVLERFKGANLKLKPSKCELLQKEVKFLGHVVNSEGVSTDPDKVKAVREWKTPKCSDETRSFLGFVGYYRKFCPDYATAAKPLNRIAAKGATFKWGAEEQEAFDKLRGFIMESPVLAYPDFTKDFLVDTDASLDGAGAVLSQMVDGEERVIAYFSKTFSPAERNYCVTRRELLAIILSTKHFRPYLYGRRFHLRTDHASLQWLYKRKEPSHQVARWLELLAEFRFSLSHRSGEKHGNADGLSRCCVDCKQCGSIEKRDGGPTRAEMTILDKVEVDGGSMLEGRRTAGQVPNTQVLEGRDLEVGSVNIESELRKEIVPLQDRTGSDVALIKECVRKNQELPTGTLEQGSVELKKLCSLMPVMKIQDNILKVRLNVNNRHIWCIVCPKELRPVVIQQYHSQYHSGVNKTYKRIRLQWFWPGMTSQVRHTVQRCEICQAAKHSNPIQSVNQQRLFAGRPWQVLSIDLVGPFSKTPRDNSWVLVLSDHFTRWRDAIPVRNGTTVCIAEALERQVFCYFGLPERIHSDRGASFESALMKELCRLWGSAKSRTTPYHASGNGVVERGNKDLGNALRTFLLARDETDWDLLLPHLTRAIRSVPHSFTGETANYMMFGRELTLPECLIAGPELEPQSREEYVANLVERLEEAYNFVRAKQDEIRANDQKEPPLFQQGDMVWLKAKRFPKGTTPKLQAKWQGPYKILEVYENHTYLLELHGRQSVESESRLKLYLSAQNDWDRAPVVREPTRQPPKPGITRSQEKKEEREERKMLEVLEKFTKSQRKEENVPEEIQSEPRTISEEPQAIPEMREDNSSSVEVKPKVRENEEISELPDHVINQQPRDDNSRSSRTRKPPARFEDYVLYKVETANHGAEPPANRREPTTLTNEKQERPANEKPSFTSVRRKTYAEAVTGHSHSKLQTSNMDNLSLSLSTTLESRSSDQGEQLDKSITDEDLQLLEDDFKIKNQVTPTTVQPTKVNRIEVCKNQGVKTGFCIGVNQGLEKLGITNKGARQFKGGPGLCNTQASHDSVEYKQSDKTLITPEKPKQSRFKFSIKALKFHKSKSGIGGNKAILLQDLPACEEIKERMITAETRKKFNRLHQVAKDQKRCDMCPKRFRDKGTEAIRQHCWSHFTVHVCQECGFTCGRSDYMPQHYKNVHTGKQAKFTVESDRDHWKIVREHIPVSETFPPLPYKAERSHRTKKTTDLRDQLSRRKPAQETRTRREVTPPPRQKRERSPEPPAANKRRDSTTSASSNSSQPQQYYTREGRERTASHSSSRSSSNQRSRQQYREDRHRHTSSSSQDSSRSNSSNRSNNYSHLTDSLRVKIERLEAKYSQKVELATTLKHAQAICDQEITELRKQILDIKQPLTFEH